MLITQRSRRTPPRAAIAAAVLSVVALVAWLAGTQAPVTPVPTQAAPSRGTGPVATPVRPGGVATAGLPAEATDPADDPARVFELGFAGGLVLEPDTVSALDRLQALLGDNPSPEAIAQIEQRLRQGLPGEDADKAIKLFEGYRGYSQDMRGEVMTMGVPETRDAAEALLARMEEVQRRHFDAEAGEAMFSEQNRVSRAVLLASLVQRDEGLTPAQKKSQLDALRASLPPAQQGAIPDAEALAASSP